MKTVAVALEDSPPDTDVVHKRINQSVGESDAERKKEVPVVRKTTTDHTAKQESSCVHHQEESPRTDSHSSDSKTFRWMPSWDSKRNSSLKPSAPYTSMEEASQPKTQHSMDKGVTGLANMRNTCYLNAALQALRHNTEISAFFLEGRHEQWIQKKPSTPKVELVRGYADLLKSLWSGSKPAYVRPQGFLQTMMPAAKAAGFDHFVVPAQHDSHEFLVFLLDQLHEGMAEEVNIDIRRAPPETEKDRDIHNALEAWKRFFGKQYSPLTEMVYGLLQITLTCQTCKKKVSNWETFNCLKLPIPTKTEGAALPTLDSMLKEDFKDETIEGYACDTCKPERTTAVRSTRIWRLPRMVCLVVKRFTPDGKKIHTPIDFPPAAETIQFTQFFSENSPEPSRNQLYQSFAAVDHHGSAGSGHYVAQAKSPLTDAWHLFDDETAHDMSEPRFGEQTYIIFLKPSVAAAAEA